MPNYNTQQQAVILKGIAQQILSMNIPTFEQVEKLFKQFGIDFEGNEMYTKMYYAVKVATSLSDESKKSIGSKDLGHLIVHTAMNIDGEIHETMLRNKLFNDCFTA